MLGLPLVVVLRLTAVASLIAERWSGSVVVMHRRSCPEACVIFPDQGLNL